MVVVLLSILSLFGRVLVIIMLLLLSGLVLVWLCDRLWLGL